MLGSELMKIFGSGTSGGGGSSGNIILVDDFVSGITDAYWAIDNDGFTYTRKDAGPFVKDAAWLNPQSGMNLYEVQAHKASGDTPSGTLDTYFNCGAANYNWGFTTTYTPKSCVLTVSIRRASDHVVLKTVSITIEASSLA